MKTIRQLHLYLGTFFAPAIFFFAFSGALQTFSLHESKDDGSYTAPSWVMTIASIHKDQRLANPHKHAHAVAPVEPHVEAAPAPTHDEEQAEPHSPFLLKCFVLLLAIGLMASAALGIYMALQSRNNRKMTWVMLAAGMLVPVSLILL
jgi:hypothetical protein